jgi:hypothetical protein
MKFKFYSFYLLLSIICLSSFYLNFTDTYLTDIENMDIGSICFLANTCYFIAIIIYTEQFQAIFYYLKTRLIKSSKILLSIINIITKHSILYILSYILIYIIFFYITKKSGVIFNIVLFLITTYLEIIIIRSILIFFMKPKHITIALLIFLSITMVISNFMSNNIMIPIMATISPFSFFPTEMILIRFLIYLILGITFRFILLKTIPINKLKITVYHILFIISIGTIFLNVYCFKNERNDAFYFFNNSLIYINFFEFMILNFLFYFILSYKFCLYCFNLKNGMFKYYQYRIQNNHKLKKLILLSFYKKLLLSFGLITIIIIILVITKRYVVTFPILLDSFIKLILIASIGNHLLLIVNKAIDEKILVILVLITILSLILTLFSTPVLAALQVVLILFIIFRKELI